LAADGGFETLEPDAGRPGAMTDVYAPSASEAFFVSGFQNGGIDSHPFVYRWAGNAWTRTNTGISGALTGITGTSSSRVFASATTSASPVFGRVLFFDGVGWTQEPLPSAVPSRLMAIWAAPTGEVFTVGYGGLVLKGP
jgi:hypothetical protein